MAKEYFTPEELAERWTVSAKNVRQRIHRQEIKAFDLNQGRRRPVWRVPASEVVRIEQEGTR